MLGLGRLVQHQLVLGMCRPAASRWCLCDFCGTMRVIWLWFSAADLWGAVRSVVWGIGVFAPYGVAFLCSRVFSFLLNRLSAPFCACHLQKDVWVCSFCEILCMTKMASVVSNSAHCAVQLKSLYSWELRMDIINGLYHGCNANSDSLCSHNWSWTCRCVGSGQGFLFEILLVIEIIWFLDTDLWTFTDLLFSFNFIHAFVGT